jgi:hypothetical protein
VSGGDVQASSASVRLGGDGSQQGDTSIGNAAGRDVFQGLNGEQLARLLEQQGEFYLTLVSSYEKAVTDATRKIERLRDEQDMANRGAFAARQADYKERAARQALLDRRLNRIEFAIVGLALLLTILAWRLWPAITAVAAMAARH